MKILKLLYSFREVKKINDSTADNATRCIGCNFCFCESYFIEQSCDSPNKSDNCLSCKLAIRAVNYQIHTLVPNNIRVYKNEAHKNNIETAFNSYKDPKFQFKCTDDFKNMINYKKQNSKPDFSQITEEFIYILDLTHPEIEPITFRTLNLVLNFYLYLNYKLIGLLDEEKYNKFKLGEIDCKENVEINLYVLDQLLEKKNIKNIALFLNFTLEKIVNIFFKTNKYMTCIQKNNKEIEINEIIQKIISPDSEDELNFNKYKEKYVQFQEIYTSIDPSSLTVLLDDEKNTRILEFEKFSDLKFFKIKKEINRDLLFKKLQDIPNFQIEYPIIFNFITKEKNLEKLKNINKLNPFVNLMINRFSYQISRKEAKLPENSIESQLHKISESQNEKIEMYNKFETFREGWKDIYRNAIQFGCRKEMAPLSDITKYDPIANVLNDDVEYRYGMYLAAGYQYLCEIQNDFLTGVENAIQKNVELFYLKNNFKNNIIVQKAKPFQVINIDDESFGIYENFEDLVYRNCYVNPINNKEIEFNFDSIEKALFNILIQGKKFFSYEQNFVVYIYESFHRNNSLIITNFSKRIPQIKINNYEKFLIFKYLDVGVGNSKKGEKTLSNLISMIFFLQSTDLKPDLSLFLTVNKIKNLVKIEKSFSDFLKNNKEFTLEKLVEIYNFTEKINYEQIKENVSIDYKIKLSVIKREKINNFYMNYPETIITRKNLSTSVRRFISRFLTQREDIDREHDLLPMLFSKDDFWEKEVFNNEKFEEENEILLDFLRNDAWLYQNSNNLIGINNENEKVEIKISEAIDLYDFLGGDKDNFIIENKYYKI